MVYGLAKKREEVPKKTKDIKDAPIPVPVPAEKSSLRKLPEPPPENKRYETEQPTAILPPPATVTQPVFVPIPVHDRRESLVKEVEREIRVVAPPKPETVDVGVNTDPWPPEKKRKVKKVDKVETVIPKGDVPDTTPFVFIRNPKPKGTPKEPPRATSAPFVAEPDCQEEEKPQENPPAPARWWKLLKPRIYRIDSRSPPPAENSAPPSKRTIRSPPAAKRPGPKLRRIPSPPRENVERGRSAEKVPEENNDSPPQIPPKRTRSQREVLFQKFVETNIGLNIPCSGISISRKAMYPGGVGESELQQAAVKEVKNDAVRAGGGGGATPVGWKPWANGSSSHSQQQQFLNAD
ncbi:hypothetical protein ANCCEY_05342 [Ancylostoma ceylanicum]|uniref:Uncharacterized protein n=1 Tax=Ancylostoma ceylanicum TaxID=53326 RepID=A0A0D6LU24_9BILA|nr:hypothetical protein ANCCEY_05342 [Ancylostoma ceylanicum]